MNDFFNNNSGYLRMKPLVLGRFGRYFHRKFVKFHVTSRPAIRDFILVDPLFVFIKGHPVIRIHLKNFFNQRNEVHHKMCNFFFIRETKQNS